MASSSSSSSSILLSARVVCVTWFNWPTFVGQYFVGQLLLVVWHRLYIANSSHTTASCCSNTISTQWVEVNVTTSYIIHFTDTLVYKLKTVTLFYHNAMHSENWNPDYQSVTTFPVDALRDFLYPLPCMDLGQLLSSLLTTWSYKQSTIGPMIGNTSLPSLQSYPAVQRVFLRYNTSLPQGSPKKWIPCFTFAVTSAMASCRNGLQAMRAMMTSI